MKLLPLIGALLLSTAPVQAFETFEELIKACGTTEENDNMCEGAANLYASGIAATLLCELEAKGILTKEEAIVSWDNLKEIFIDNSRNPMWHAGEKDILEVFPECSIKRIP